VQLSQIIKNFEKKLRLYKDFGRRKPGTDVHDYLGYNFKITDMQSVIALGQLGDIKKRIDKKKKIFKRYYNNLKKNPKIKLFEILNNETPWSVDIYINNVKKIKHKLKKHNISTRLVYPPLNSQKIYRKFKNLPVSNFFCKRGLWLPSSLDLNNKKIDLICRYLNKYV